MFTHVGRTPSAEAASSFTPAAHDISTPSDLHESSARRVEAENMARIQALARDLQQLRADCSTFMQVGVQLCDETLESRQIAARHTAALEEVLRQAAQQPAIRAAEEAARATNEANRAAAEDQRLAAVFRHANQHNAEQVQKLPRTGHPPTSVL